jgi:UDPglucose--hexose-1-phosphate uridylyltransferase
MATVRIDPLTGDPVVISEHRVPAPPAFMAGNLPRVAICPFCPGHEHLTGPTIHSRDAEGAWVARAFPNRRPALRPEEAHHPIGGGHEVGHTALGAHEVIAEGAQHGVEPSIDAHRAALHLAADRLDDLRRDTRFAAIGWFRNRGLEAGSSQPHPHAQITATPLVPRRVASVTSAQLLSPGLMQQLADDAARDGRVVWERQGVVAFTPWAPASPFEVWLAPTAPVARLALDRARVDDLADGLLAVAHALHSAFVFCSYNAVLHEPPTAAGDTGLSWHLRVMPRLVPVAGFELWSGGAMHPCEPVRSAAVLRGLVR